MSTAFTWQSTLPPVLSLEAEKRGISCLNEGKVGTYHWDELAKYRPGLWLLFWWMAPFLYSPSFVILAPSAVIYAITYAAIAPATLAGYLLPVMAVGLWILASIIILF